MNKLHASESLSLLSPSPISIALGRKNNKKKKNTRSPVKIPIVKPVRNDLEEDINDDLNEKKDLYSR
jgi:hypothetical protein